MSIGPGSWGSGSSSNGVISLYSRIFRERAFSEGRIVPIKGGQVAHEEYATWPIGKRSPCTNT